MAFDHECLDVYQVALEFLTLGGSATESAALLDVYARLELATPNDYREGKQMLERIVSMLVRLAKSFERG